MFRILAWLCLPKIVTCTTWACKSASESRRYIHTHKAEEPKEKFVTLLHARVNRMRIISSKTIWAMGARASDNLRDSHKNHHIWCANCAIYACVSEQHVLFQHEHILALDLSSRCQSRLEVCALPKGNGIMTKQTYYAIYHFRMNGAVAARCCRLCVCVPCVHARTKCLFKNFRHIKQIQWQHIKCVMRGERWLPDRLRIFTVPLGIISSILECSRCQSLRFHNGSRDEGRTNGRADGRMDDTKLKKRLNDVRTNEMPFSLIKWNEIACVRDWCRFLSPAHGPICSAKGLPLATTER